MQELEAQKIREEMNRSEAVFQAQSAVITGREQSKVRTVEEVEICYGEIVEDIEGRIAAAEEQKAEIFYNISSESLIELVRKQQERCPVVLKKVKAETTALQVRSRDICLKIKTERLNIGDDMKFSFKSSRSGYITLLCFGTSCLPAADFGGVGKVSVLEPNFLDGVCRVEAGREYLLPGDHFLAGQYLAQEGPAGVERICAIVTDKPLLRVPAGLEDFDQLSRAELASLAADLSLFPGESWAGGYLSYRVE